MANKKSKDIDWTALRENIPNASTGVCRVTTNGAIERTYTCKYCGQRCQVKYATIEPSRSVLSVCEPCFGEAHQEVAA